MKRFEVKAICTMVFPDIFANNKHDAIQEVINKLPTNVEKDGVLKCAVILDDVSAECYDLMDTSNNHNAELVERINRAYEEEREKFHEIVNFLIEKQGEGRFSDCATMFVRSQFYCQCIADDQDLETILCYCRV